MAKQLNIKDLLDPEKAKKHIPELTEFFEEGGTWQILMGLSEEALEGQYAIGYNYYEEGQLEEAILAFTTLTILNPYDTRFWIALGSSQYLENRYEEAANAYLLAGATDEENPDLRFQAGLCFEELGKKDEAIKAYEEGLRLTLNNDLLASLLAERIAKLT